MAVGEPAGEVVGVDVAFVVGVAVRVDVGVVVGVVFVPQDANTRDIAIKKLKISPMVFIFTFSSPYFFIFKTRTPCGLCRRDESP